jgi:3-keto-5-aminohexanoate cleavage enzyme
VNLVSYVPVAQKIRNENDVHANSYENIRYFLEASRELGLRPTIQIFEPGYIRVALYFFEQGILTEPLLLKFYFGSKEVPFSLPPNSKSIEIYLDMLKGVRCNWFSATLGADNLPLVPLTVSIGGHVRVGLEDYQYANDGQLTNRQIVERAAAASVMGHEPATPEEARKILQL